VCGSSAKFRRAALCGGTGERFRVDDRHGELGVAEIVTREAFPDREILTVAVGATIPFTQRIALAGGYLIVG